MFLPQGMHYGRPCLLLCREYTTFLQASCCRVMPGGMTYEATILETCMALQKADKDLTSRVRSIFR